MTAAATAGIPCYGDGSSGNRVLAVYARPADRPDRFDQVLGQIHQWAADVDAAVAGSAGARGGVRHVRFVTDASCNLVVHKVTLTLLGDDTFANTIAEFTAQGLNRPDRKYLVWMDANVMCGIANYYVDPRPGQDNLNNGAPTAPGTIARTDTGCWGMASRGGSVEAHELMHMLGAVQPTAPHATPLGHCTDDADRMCYADGSPLPINKVCVDGNEALFDCNADDYFNPSPAGGSFLATNWNAASNSFLASQAPGAGAPPPSASGDAAVRIAGTDRVTTAVSASQSAFPNAGSARGAVVASATSFADALPGTPLAAAKGGPLLLTAGGALDERVAAEIRRGVAPGSTVYVLGGEAVISQAVATRIQQLGYPVTRLGGANRYATAAAIAERGLGNPTTIFEATGLSFPDALAGGAAAAATSGAILLTNGSTQAPETAAYLATHPVTRRYALGGPAAAADPTATAISGADRFQTAIRVADTFFGGAPAAVGAASGFSFPDALAGGAHIAIKGGPMLLLSPSGAVPPVVANYLKPRSSSIRTAYVYGGQGAVQDDVLWSLQGVIT